MNSKREIEGGRWEKMGEGENNQSEYVLTSM